MDKPNITAVVGRRGDGTFAVTNVRIERYLTDRADAAIDAAKEIVAVKDDATLADAVDVLGLLKGAFDAIEESRKSVKKPFDEAVKLIQKEAKRVTDPLVVQLDIIKGMVGRYQGEKVRLELARQAELERRSRELQKASMETQDPERSEKLEDAAHELHLEARMARSGSIAGASVRPTYVPELVDFVKVANTNPHLLKQELALLNVNDMIRQLSDGGKTPLDPDAIPGIRLTPSASVGVR